MDGMTVIRSRDGFNVVLPSRLTRGRKGWLRTWSYANLIALPGAWLARQA